MEQNKSVDNSDHREDDTAAQEQCCEVAETMAVPEDVQQFWDDQLLCEELFVNARS